MTFRQHLARTGIVALAALLAVALILAGYSAFQAWLAPSAMFGVAGTAIVFLAYTFMIGTLPVVLFGAPIYAWLLHIGKASWFSALAIGVAPGLLFLLVASDLGFFSMSCGAVVALATHAFSSRALTTQSSGPPGLHSIDPSRQAGGH